MAYLGLLFAVLLPMMITALGLLTSPTEVKSDFQELLSGTVELGQRLGVEVESHSITTSDGYIIICHRIAGNGPPVIFAHGMFGSSKVWMLQDAEKNIAVQLAKEGYDVWLMNLRGNLYGENHTTLTTNDQKFWDFSFHEMGLYDLRATIDFVLNVTGYDQVIYICHSMGCATFAVLISELPEYAEKIKVCEALAPAIITGQSPSFITRLGAEATRLYPPGFNGKLDIAMPAWRWYILCGDRFILYPICGVVYESVFGRTDGVNKSMLAFYYKHVTENSSIRTIWHLFQNIKTGEFRKYDFGAKTNLLKYGTEKPPKYNISQVNVLVNAYCGKTDPLVICEDIKKLTEMLPNATFFSVIAHLCNHYDFLLSQDVGKLLNVHIMNDIQNS